MVVGFKVALAGRRDRVQVRAKGVGCADDSWEESPFSEMGDGADTREALLLVWFTLSRRCL